MTSAPTPTVGARRAVPLPDATRITVRAREHDTLDALTWRHTGRTAGVVEATLDATPGLAARAADLGASEQVTLVVAPAPSAPLIQLWD